MSASLRSKSKHEAGFLGFIERQLFTRRRPVPSTVNLTGQTAVVTGANGGLGLAAARQLLKLGLSRLIIAVRTPSKGEAAAGQLRASFPAATVDVWTVDMASYASIRAFARRCADELPRLDVVILNAGAQVAKFTRAPETGHETAFQVNYLSTILLAALLLPVLRASKHRNGTGAPGRLTVVSSDTAFMSSLNKPRNPLVRQPIVPQLDKEEGFVVLNRYSDGKLLLIVGMAKLAEYVDPADVVFNAVNPGFCGGTELQRDVTNPVVGAIISAAKGIFGRSPEVGASTYIDAALVQGPKSHGSYCSEWTIKPFPEIMYTEEGRAMQEGLWQETMEELKADNVAALVEQLRK